MIIIECTQMANKVTVTHGPQCCLIMHGIQFLLVTWRQMPYFFLTNIVSHYSKMFSDVWHYLSIQCNCNAGPLAGRTTDAGTCSSFVCINRFSHRMSSQKPQKENHRGNTECEWDRYKGMLAKAGQNRFPAGTMWIDDFLLGGKHGSTNQEFKPLDN